MDQCRRPFDAGEGNHQADQGGLGCNLRRRTRAIAWEKRLRMCVHVDIRPLLVDMTIIRQRSDSTRTRAGSPYPTSCLCHFVQALASRIKLARIERYWPRRPSRTAVYTSLRQSDRPKQMQIKSLHSAAAGQLKPSTSPSAGKWPVWKRKSDSCRVKFPRGAASGTSRGGRPVERKIQELHEVFEQVNEHLKTASEAYGREVRRQIPDWEGLEASKRSKSARTALGRPSATARCWKTASCLQKEIEIE
jgi:hypothetical protein